MSRLLKYPKTLIVLTALLLSALVGVLSVEMNSLQAYSESISRFTNLHKLIPAHPGSVFLPMGDEVDVGGWSREMGYALTKDSAFKVAERYQAIFEGEGLVVERRSDEVSESVVAFAPGDEWLRTIVATKNQAQTFGNKLSGGSTIIASITPALAGFKAPDIPTPPDCQVVSHTGARDQNIRTRLAFFECEGYVEDVVKFYDQELLGSTKKVMPGSKRNSKHLHYSSAARSVDLVLVQSPQKDTDKGPRLALSLTWQERE